MEHDHITMPADVRQEIEHQLGIIRRSTTREDAEKAGFRAQGFVLGIERLRALRPIDIETLYLLFEHTVEQRLKQFAAND